jgi:hypothetical protein
MRYLLAVGLAALVCCLSLAAFWRAHVRNLPIGPGALTERLEELASAWTAKNVPFDARAVTFVIGDAEALDDPLALVDAPSLIERTTGWLRRAIGGRFASAPDSRLAHGFDGDAAAIVWSHAAFPTAEDEDDLRELMAAIVKAHDAGAELNIVTQGRSASLVLKAIASLDGTVRGGQKVGVNKLVTIGINHRALAAFGPAFKIGRPGNLLEWTSIWNTESMPRATEIEVLGAEPDVARYTGEMLDSTWGAGLQDAVPLIRSLIASPATMRRQLEGRVAASHAPTISATTSAAFQPASAPSADSAHAQDSLAMISGGGGFKMPDSDSSGAVAVKRPPVLKATTVVRPTRTRYRGDYFNDREDACHADYPETTVQASFTCNLGKGDKDRPVEEYPEAWVWTNNYDGNNNCPRNASPEAMGTIARRGTKKLARCSELYPIACCVYTAARQK